MSKLFDKIKTKNDEESVSLSVQDYLKLCKKEPETYATPAERMLKAIGEPEKIDTSLDPDRLGRIFFNRTIKVYPSFSEFYGMEDTIEQIVDFFKHASQGLEEKKQILYLLGPVGGGKSSIAERLKELICQVPIYVLCDKDGKMSPVFESPLGLFSDEKQLLQSEYGIPKDAIPACPSPWATKRLRDYDGDVTQFKVCKVYPSQQRQIGVSKVEPGDDNNQDIGTLVGKTDIRQLGIYEQSDTDSYSYSGGLCRSNQGVLEFVEMFKAPLKVLNPLLTATQERNYKGTENIGAIPFQGIILAHSNESEWSEFSANKNNEAFLDRVNLIRVPYCLRYNEEIMIYEKLIRHSKIRDAIFAPKTLEILSQFSVLTRLTVPENSSLYAKMKVYNGENLKATNKDAKSLQEYKDTAGIEEGMSGMSTRFAYKVLSKTLNYDPDEIAANPVHLLYNLEKEVSKLSMDDVTQDTVASILKWLSNEYADFLEKELQKAYIEAYDDYGQNIFEKYVEYADHYLQEKDFRDPETGSIMDMSQIERELEKIEKPASIANTKDFRNEVVSYVLRYKAANSGSYPTWNNYEKIKEVIESRIFTNMEEMLPVIKFDPKASTKDKKKHQDFVSRMEKLGYTAKQVKILVKWFEQNRS